MYLDRGRFRQSHFDFAISLANITAVALVRALHEESLVTDFQRLKEKSPGYDELVGESPAMRELKDKIGRLGRASGCVLIRGESGTGKELIARALHRASPRADRPMLAVNCAAIPAGLDRQPTVRPQGRLVHRRRSGPRRLFPAGRPGHAVSRRNRRDDAWRRNPKLLRVLEGHPFLPVGGTQEVKVDVRVIAATNRDLLDYVPREEISRGPVLSAERFRAGRPAAARARQRYRPADRLSFSSPFFAAARPAGLDTVEGRRARNCWATPGPATCGNCAT